MANSVRPGYPAQPYAGRVMPTSDYPSAEIPSPDRPGSVNPLSRRRRVGAERGGQASARRRQLRITPGTAAVFVDGTYVGTAGTFGPTSQPLGLVSDAITSRSAHRIPDDTFDADVRAAGHPYQGTLSARLIESGVDASSRRGVCARRRRVCLYPA